MDFPRQFSVAALFSVMAVAFAGCGGGPAATPAGSSATSTVEPAHNHPEHGPHGGDLVELGDEEYHAEIVHEADGTLSVYILDGAATNMVPIDAAEISLNVVHDGEAEQFALAAMPLESDAAGQSSRFVSADAHAGEELDHEGAQAKLAVTINGTSYQGSVEHDHAHGDHSHGDHAHDGGDHQH
mgnify:FL=1